VEFPSLRGVLVSTWVYASFSLDLDHFAEGLREWQY
jgi:hypothetical protein